MIRFPRIGYEFLRIYSKAKRNGKYPKHIFLLAGTMNVHCTCMSTLATCTVKVPVFFLTLFFSEIIIKFIQPCIKGIGSTTISNSRPHKVLQSNNLFSTIRLILICKMKICLYFLIVLAFGSVCWTSPMPDTGNKINFLLIYPLD